MSKRTKHSVTVWEDFWARKQDIQTVYQTSERIFDHIRSLGPLKSRWILEVGAGTGRDSLRLSEKGARVIILDYAKNSLQIVQKLIKQQNSKAYVIQADAFHLPFRSNSIDIVFHQGLLEHFKTPLPIVLENYRVLKPNGHALVDVPQRYHIYTLIKHILIGLDVWFAGWETEFSVSELTGLLKKAGFRIAMVYGDWMRPSLCYRMLRELLLKMGAQLPLYPRGIAGIQKIRERLRKRLQKMKFSYYTCLDIGAIGIKERADRG